MSIYKSDKIRVFPSSKRDDAYDRNARLNTEHNLISLVNRLTGSKSFVIWGLDILSQDEETITFNEGSCNIYGYYFEFNSQNEIKPNDDAEFIYLQITLKPFTVQTVNDIAIQINELEGTDTSSEYSGVQLLSSKTEPDDGVVIDDKIHYNLILAKKYTIGTSSTWKNYNNTIISNSIFAVDEGNLSD